MFAILVGIVPADEARDGVVPGVQLSAHPENDLGEESDTPPGWGSQLEGSNSLRP